MGRVITFYSYKGGVGRTMSLANVAILLSKWGYKTLMVDWDLEAPGLEFFFKDLLDLEETCRQEGIVDLLDKASDGQLPADKPVNWQESLINIKLPEQQGALHLLTAGKRDEDYFNKVRGLDLKSFYENQGGFFIERLRDEWKGAYDYVLVDSRTGVTDIGGVCTIQLPDVLAALFTATDQSLRGVIDVFRKANRAHQKLPVSRLSLQALPIPSRFDTGTEFKISQDWLDRFASELGEFYANWLPINVKRRDFLATTKIPYVAYFSFGEKLPVLEEGTVDPAGLGYAYENLAALIANNLEYADRLLENRDLFVKAAFKGAKRDELLNGDSAARIETSPRLGPRVYLSYAREDRKRVEEIYRKLSQAGFTPWMDTMDLLPGEQWESSINKAIERSDFFLLCLSPYSAARSHRTEVQMALDLWNRRFQKGLWLIPVRLEETDVPEEMREVLWLDLFGEGGWESLVQTLREGVKRRETDRAVIFTSQSIEHEAVRKHLFDLQEKTLPDGTEYEVGRFSSRDRHWEVSIVEIEKQNPDVAHEVARAIHALNPSIVLSVGVAAGFGKVSIGDVVVGTNIYGLEKASLIRETVRSSRSLTQRARAEARKTDWWKRLGGTLSAPAPTIVMGEIVASSALRELPAILPSLFKGMSAFDPGGYNLLSAIHLDRQINTLAIRGIAEMALRSAEADPSIAAQHASAFAFEVLAKLKREDVATGKGDPAVAANSSVTAHH
jgi:cellulose biosynthesis protein BcsQ